MWFRSFFRSLREFFTGPSEPAETECLTLRADGRNWFTGNTGERIPGVCAVIVRDDDTGAPAAGVDIRYQVVSGPGRFPTSDGDTSTRRTDDQGRAIVDVQLTSVGRALVSASLADSDDVGVFFEGRSQGVTDRLEIATRPTFPVDPGLVTADITAVDHNGDPVSGADIVFEGAYGADTEVVGEVEELGGGRYRGTFTTQIAGPWTILAEDMTTKVVVDTCVHLVPDAPHVLRAVGETDPRMVAPYSTVDLRARLDDRFGNALAPSNIECRAGGQLVAPTSVGEEEARFPVSFVGYGSVDVVLSDAESNVSSELTIEFAASWLSDPGIVLVGSTFETVLYALPPPDRAALRGRIDIDFDPELVSFAGVEPARGGLIRSVTPTREGRLLSLEVEAEREVFADEFPEGGPVCTVSWTCLGEGECCFGLVASMSPSTPKWERCVQQKKADPECICVNIIYKSGDAAALTAGKAAANEVPSIVSSNANVARCCPVLSVKIQETPLGASDWAKVTNVVGANGLSSKTEIDALFNAKVGQKAKCVNITMLEINWGGFDGWTYYGYPFGSDRGFGALEPDEVGKAENGNLGAHEIGHALNLLHEGASGDNLMSQNAPHGANLTKDQCKTVFQNLALYPCP